MGWDRKKGGMGWGGGGMNGERGKEEGKEEIRTILVCVWDLFLLMKSILKKVSPKLKFSKL